MLPPPIQSPFAAIDSYTISRNSIHVNNQQRFPSEISTHVRMRRDHVNDAIALFPVY